MNSLRGITNRLRKNFKNGEKELTAALKLSRKHGSGGDD
jgi:hypothetical protein